MQLYEHQKTALAYLRSLDSFMLFMEQGTGKTIPTLTRLNELIKSKAIKTALVICPKSVMGSWDRDIQMFDTESQIRLKTHVEIINYDKVWRYDRNKFNPYDRQYDSIVIDEAHSIKNRTSKRAAFILKIAVQAKYRYALTGTPISNGQLENFWSLICFLDPYLVGSRVYSNIFRLTDGGKGTYYEFLDKYALLDQFHKPYRYRKISELQEIVDQYSYRVTKNECLDLPDKLPDEIIELELPDKKLYKGIAKHSASLEMEFVADNPLVKLTKLRQIASGFLIDDTGEAVELKCEKIKAGDSYDDIKTALNVSLDPAISATAVIITNQNGFDYLDQVKLDNGLPLLQPVLTDPTKKQLSGRIIHVVKNERLSDVSGAHPFFVGDMAEFCKFFDREQVTVDLSTDAGFNMNAAMLRAIERFDVQKADVKAMVYLQITPA